MDIVAVMEVPLVVELWMEKGDDYDDERIEI